jgi:hypothetical protein
MRTLLKYELMYNLKHYLIIMLMPAIYTAALILNISFLDDTQPASKVVWPLLAGYGPVIYIAILTARYSKLGRLRSHMVLPLDIKSVSIVRMIIIILPLFAVLLFSALHLLLVFTEWQIITDRIFYAQGVYFFVLSCGAAAYDLFFTLRLKTSWKKLFVVCAVLIFCIPIIFYADSILFPILYQPFIGMIYFALAVVILFADSKIYSRRNNFLM